MRAIVSDSERERPCHPQIEVTHSAVLKALGVEGSRFFF